MKIPKPSPLDVQMTAQPPLPISASPWAAHTGSIKAGGLLHVLDLSQQTQPMRDAIDSLLIKYHGQKDLLMQVDAEYAACIQCASRDHNSFLHTTKHHVSHYLKHLAKSTNSSLNTNKLQVTQQLWHHLTEDSETVHVSVVTLALAPVNPPSVKPQEPAFTEEEIQQTVKNVVAKEKQQKLQQPLKNRTRSCLVCGQPKSR